MPRSPDTAEPTKTRAERWQAGASIGGEHPTPSRKARKIILPRAYSASAGLMPRSPDTAEPTKTRAERCQAGASLGGEHSNPLAQSAKANPSQSLLSERRPDAAEPRPPKPQRSGVRPERALEANTQPPRAKRESSSSPEPTQRAQA